MDKIYQIKFDHKLMGGATLNIPEDGGFYVDVNDALKILKKVYNRLVKRFGETNYVDSYYCQEFGDGIDSLTFSGKNTDVFGKVVEFSINPAGCANKKYCIDWDIKTSVCGSVWGSLDVEVEEEEKAKSEFDKKVDFIIDNFKDYLDKDEVSEEPEVSHTMSVDKRYSFTNQQGNKVDVICEKHIVFKDGKSAKVRLLYL